MQHGEHAIVFFDGVCNLCNSSVNFIIRNDKKGYFKFAPLQSKKAEEFLDLQLIKPNNTPSIILYENGKIFRKSSAALHITRKLDGFYCLFFVFIIIPPFVRNFIYDYIAKNRYHWFGKKETCMIPDPGVKKRFLEFS